VDNNARGDWTLSVDDTCSAMIQAFAATRATIRGLRVDRCGPRGVATGTQQGSRSFRVFGVHDKEGSGRVPLHERPLAAVVSDSVTPMLYGWRPAPSRRPTWRSAREPTCAG